MNYIIGTFFCLPESCTVCVRNLFLLVSIFQGNPLLIFSKAIRFHCHEVCFIIIYKQLISRSFTHLRREHLQDVRCNDCIGKTSMLPHAGNSTKFHHLRSIPAKTSAGLCSLNDVIDSKNLGRFSGRLQESVFANQVVFVVAKTGWIIMVCY